MRAYMQTTPHTFRIPCIHPSANLRTGGGLEVLREGPRPTGGSRGCDPVGANRPCTDRDRGRERGPACPQSALRSSSCCGGSLQTPVGVSRRSKQRLKRRWGTFYVPPARTHARFGANVYFCRNDVAKATKTNLNMFEKDPDGQLAIGIMA